MAWWRGVLCLAFAIGCGDNTAVPRLVELGSEAAPASTTLDDHARLWGAFSNKRLSVFGGAYWQSEQAWPEFAGLIAADTIDDVAVSNGHDIWRVRLDPPSAHKVVPEPVFRIASLDVLPGGVLLVTDEYSGAMETLTPGDTTWRASPLTFSSPPWQSRTHELIGVTTNGRLLHVIDADRNELLAAGLDSGKYVAGVNHAGRVVLHDGGHVYEVVDGTLVALDTDERDLFVRVIATPEHVVAAVLRMQPDYESVHLLVEITENGTVVIDEGGSERTSLAVELHADAYGHIYVVDRGWIGVIDF